MEILAYGVASYERPLLAKAFEGRHDLRCLDVNLDADTAVLADGYAIVSTNVNSRVDADVLRRIAGGGTKLVTQGSTGFNTIDLDAAARRGITVMRVSHYSPHSVAEFAWALAHEEALLVNTSRGGLMDSFALVAALRREVATSTRKKSTSSTGTCPTGLSPTTCSPG